MNAPAPNANPRVSVLMTMFNASAFLRPAAESVLAQSFRDFEFIIVDDGSTDDSAAVVEGISDSRIRLIRNAVNKGQTACLNQGLAEARGEFIARQDADDLSRPDRLAKQVGFLDAHPETVLLGGNAEQIDIAGRSLGFTDLPRDTAAIRWGNLFDNSFLHSAVMFRAWVICEEFGGYDETFRCSQDYALWSRITRQRAVANLPDSLVALRVHSNSMMRAPNSALEVETDRILRANLAAEFPSRKFSEEEIGALSEYRSSISRGALPRFTKLFESLRTEFLKMQPIAREGSEFRRTEALQFSRIAYNILERDRSAAFTAYAHALRKWPRLVSQLPWPRILALAMLGNSARTLHQRLLSAKK